MNGHIWLVRLMTLLWMVEIILPLCDKSFGEKWNPSWAPEPRDDLRCQMNLQCQHLPARMVNLKVDKCCVCQSCAVWEGSEIDLFIEYIFKQGKSLVIAHQEATSQDAVYKIEHENSEMSEIPSNLCDSDNDTLITEKYQREFNEIKVFWEKIVIINFRNNKIRSLGNLNCLTKLDNLNLRDNRLTHIANTSFSNLSRLRFIDFSRNWIQTLDYSTLFSKHLNIFRADFSYNRMQKLDVSNIFGLNPFCEIQYYGNGIAELVNEFNHHLNMTSSYGPGHVRLRQNCFETWPDFKELLYLKDITQMAKLIHIALDLHDISINCDCNLEPFVAEIDKFIPAIWARGMNVSCSSPKNLVGIPVLQVKLEKFVCEATPSTACPSPYCKCIDKPNANTLYVDCSYKNGSFLDYVPPVEKSKFSNFVSLNFSGQQLTNITNLTKLANINMLDLSGNDLTEISTEVAEVLENTTWVDLSDNYDLHELPKAFLQYRNICSTNMRNLQIYCNCESAWVERWVKSKSCINEEKLFSCILPNGKTINAQSFNEDELQCGPTFQYTKELVNTGLIVFLILTGTFVYVFRYELLILLVRIKQLSKSSKVANFEYDVFLSFNNKDEDVVKWINSFQKRLTKAGYNVFLPTLDLPFGTERDTEILSTINQSRNFVITLTDNYLEQAEPGLRSMTENEWKYGWHNFLRDRYKNIVLINLDHVSSFDIDHSQIKAFLRVGCVVEFNNHDRKIIKRIFKILGKPYNPPAHQRKAHENKKPIFPHTNLHMHVENNVPYVIEVQDIEKDKDYKTSSIKKYIPEMVNEKIKEENALSFVRDKCKGTMSKKIQHKRRCLACSYKESELEKTPDIPLFKKKGLAEKGQSLNQSSLKNKNMENFYVRYLNTDAMKNVQHDMNKHVKDEQNKMTGDKKLKKHSEMYTYSVDEEFNNDMSDSQSETDFEISVNNETSNECDSSNRSIQLSFGSRSMADVSV